MTGVCFSFFKYSCTQKYEQKKHKTEYRSLSVTLYFCSATQRSTSSRVRRTNTEATRRASTSSTWTAADQSSHSAFTATWQVGQHTNTCRSHTSAKVKGHMSLLLPITRGQNVDGGAAQQLRADHSVGGNRSALSTLWVHEQWGAAGCHHWPLRSLPAGTELPLQEVPPLQHPRYETLGRF